MAQPTLSDADDMALPPVLAASPTSSDLAKLAQRYLQQEVFGVQAKGTFAGKAHDLDVFVRWFEAVNALSSTSAPWLKDEIYL